MSLLGFLKKMSAGGFVIGDSQKAYPGKLTPFVLFTCVVAAMGGLIFGYNIGISGGVTSMPSFLERFFTSVYRKQQENATNNMYCQYESSTLTMFTSSLYLAALVSSLLASAVTRNCELRRSMLFAGILSGAGALINGFAIHVRMLIVGRILLGLGIGFANQAVPLYLSEMAPYKYRGALNIGFQLSITIGILVAGVLNYFFAKIKGGLGWQLSLGGAVVPALIILIGSIVLPDTPYAMIELGQHEDAKTKLRRNRGVDDISQEFDDLVAAGKKLQSIEHQWLNLFRRKYRPYLTMAVMIPFFQQLTGINVIMFYAPVMFNAIGLTTDASLMSVVVTGSVNVAATLVSIYGVDKWGRRFLFLVGGTQMLICLAVVAACIGAKFGVDGTPGELPKWYAIVVVTFICIYVAGFACSWGPLGWLVPSEIFPLEIRSAAQSVTVSVNMIITFIMAQIFLTMLCHLKFGLFLVFAFFVVVMSIFVYIFLPETKGIPIEEMGQLWRTHWYWLRFVEHDGYGNALEMGSDVEQSFERVESLAGSSNKERLRELPLFEFQVLAAATDNFSLINKLGQGGFGPVYKGTLQEGQDIAVKRLSQASGQGLEELVNEVVVISKLQHRNLVKLLGCCIARKERMLVYEFMPNKSLDYYLFDTRNAKLLDWKTRFNIIIGICRGLLYLHRDSRLKIIHRDLKASNILLDENLNPKISDFGLARIFPGNEDESNTRRVVGTYGYMAPEYAMGGQFSEKSDVFSLGVILLEIVSGKRNSNSTLLPYVWSIWNEREIKSLVDPEIFDQLFEKEIQKCIHIGLLCVQEAANDRPCVSTMCSMLSSEIVDIPVPKQPAFIPRSDVSESESSENSNLKSTINYVTITYVTGR